MEKKVQTSISDWPADIIALFSLFRKNVKMAVIPRDPLEPGCSSRPGLLALRVVQKVTVSLVGAGIVNLNWYPAAQLANQWS